jgi:hypothetical protein
MVFAIYDNKRVVLDWLLTELHGGFITYKER